MTNKNSTKRVLLISVMAMVLCCTMLIGTTFAWFTDTASSTGNKIVAGTLDVKLLMHNGTDYVDISETSAPIFGAEENAVANSNNANTVWEPGKTQVAYLAIENAGNLDLKYQVALSVENVSKNLYEVMQYTITPDAKNGDVTAWDANKGVAVIEGTQVVSGDGTTADVTLESGVTHYFALSVHMLESAGNEYQGGQVDFDLTVLATQVNTENDSFNPDYDKDANYLVTTASWEAFISAVENGYDIYLEDTLVVDENAIAYMNSVGMPALADDTQNIEKNAVIDGNGITVYRTEKTAAKPLFSVAAGCTLTLSNITLDGGAEWSGEVDETLLRGTINKGIATTGALIATAGNAHIVLNEGAVLQNNSGANAVSLATRGGGSLTLNGAYVINNTSAAGAIWGGGNITINEGSKVNGNHATSIGGAIRMVDGYNNITFTMNGGEMNNNHSDSTGGAIWGGNRSSYHFNGGEMAYNSAAKAGGAIWSGTYEKYYITGDFEMHHNTAVELGGAIRFCDHASLTMTGGKIYGNTIGDKSDAFFLNNNSATITGGEIADDFSYSGGLGLTVGDDANITGTISFNLATNHNTAYLAANFNTFKFTVNEESANFAQFNFKPAEGYTYTEGDEEKLVCMNEGYETYWDAANGVFKIREKA